MRFFNLLGLYDAALDDALELEEKVRRTMGKDNAIYASCLNNIALMNKMVRLLHITQPILRIADITLVHCSMLNQNFILYSS